MEQGVVMETGKGMENNRGGDDILGGVGPESITDREGMEQEVL